MSSARISDFSTEALENDKLKYKHIALDRGGGVVARERKRNDIYEHKYFDGGEFPTLYIIYEIKLKV